MMRRHTTNMRFISQARVILISTAMIWLMISLAIISSCTSIKSSGSPGAISAPTTLEIRHAKDEPRSGFHMIDNPATGKPLYISDKAVVTGADIDSAKAVLVNGQPAVEFKLTNEGEQKISEFTRNHINEKAAIILNGKLSAAPTIKGVIKKRGIIHGNFTMDEAKQIARDLSM